MKFAEIMELEAHHHGFGTSLPRFKVSHVYAVDWYDGAAAGFCIADGKECLFYWASQNELEREFALTVLSPEQRVGFVQLIGSCTATWEKVCEIVGDNEVLGYTTLEEEAWKSS